ncbi:MAG: hypothetical protein V4724_31695 [Pseudomonadota bacterium]
MRNSVLAMMMALFIAGCGDKPGQPLKPKVEAGKITAVLNVS